jgi:NO-binding membrane sensor protein with MHYT domain
VNYRPSNALLWFGVLGGPCAWAAQFVASLAFSFAQCNQPVARWQLPVHGWQIALGVAGVAIGLAAEVVSLRIFLRTREADNAPPAGRIHFLAVVGLTVNFLALAIMMMTVIGAPLLEVCRQS